MKCLRLWLTQVDAERNQPLKAINLMRGAVYKQLIFNESARGPFDVKMKLGKGGRQA